MFTLRMVSGVNVIMITPYMEYVGAAAQSPGAGAVCISTRGSAGIMAGAQGIDVARCRAYLFCEELELFYEVQ